MISTSEIKISVVVDDKDADKATQLLHAEFVALRHVDPHTGASDAGAFTRGLIFKRRRSSASRQRLRHQRL